MGFFVDEYTGDLKAANMLLAFIALIILLTIGGCALTYLGTAANVATAPARVLNDTMTTQNIRDSYESFRNEKANYDQRLNQIAELKGILHQTRADKRSSQDDIYQAQVNLSGARASCRDVAAHYNAESSQANHNVFKFGGHTLPQRLNEGNECDS